MQFPLSFQILAKKLGIFPSIGARFKVYLFIWLFGRGKSSCLHLTGFQNLSGVFVLSLEIGVK
jgi:hypothetical protein